MTLPGSDITNPTIEMDEIMNYSTGFDDVTWSISSLGSLIFINQGLPRQAHWPNVLFKVINIHEPNRHHSMIRMFAAGQPNLGGAVMGSNAVQPSADFQRNALLLEELGDEMHILIVCLDDLTLFI